MTPHPFPSRISKEEINAFPQVQFTGKIHLIDTPKDIRPALARLKQENFLGFDTETRPSFRKGKRHSVSLLQLATAEEVFLFRLNHIHLPTTLKQLLANSNLLKLGVAVHDDIKALQQLSHFEPAGFVDFAQIAKKLTLKNSGLRSLAAIFLGVRVSKGARLSNWENPELTLSQQIYAATDAWICREMYMQLLNAGLSQEFLRSPINSRTQGKEGKEMVEDTHVK